jgi:hypothetical protein
MAGALPWPTRADTSAPAVHTERCRQRRPVPRERPGRHAGWAAPRPEAPVKVPCRTGKVDRLLPVTPGATPAVIAETHWASQQCDPAWLPNRIEIVTRCTASRRRAVSSRQPPDKSSSAVAVSAGQHLCSLRGRVGHQSGLCWSCPGRRRPGSNTGRSSSGRCRCRGRGSCQPAG